MARVAVDVVVVVRVAFVSIWVRPLARLFLVVAIVAVPIAFSSTRVRVNHRQFPISFLEGSYHSSKMVPSKWWHR